MIYLKELEKDLTASFFKEKLLNRLHQIGIPELDIRISIESESSSDKHQNRIGFYRQRSQFLSKPYMVLSLKNTYRSLVDYGHINNFSSFEDVKTNVVENMIDTICHEYGHVIEEYLNVNYMRENSRDPNLEINKVFKDFKNDFEDNEDFAEQFGLWLSRRDIMSDENALAKVYNYYCKEVFSEYALEWVKLPKFQRDIVFILDNDKKMAKWDVISDDMVGQSLKVSQDIIKTLKNSSFETKLIKVSFPKNYNSFNLEDIKFENYSHNIVKISNDEQVWYLDLLYEHTGTKKFMTQEDLDLVWGSINEIENSNKKKVVLK